MREPKIYITKDPHIPVYQPTCMDILALYYKKGNSMLVTKREFYKDLKLKYPQLSKYTDNQISKHIKDFNKFVATTAAHYRDGLMLPANMGLLMICTMGKFTEAVDHKTSKKLGRLVHYKNDHSEGYGGGLYYSTTQIPEGKTVPERMYANCEYWTLSATKSIRVLINKRYEEDWKFFHVLPKSRRYSDMIDSYQKKLKTKKAIKEIKDTYDEFDFDTK